MSVDRVNNQGSVIGSTLKAGMAGAAIGAGAGYLVQKKIIAGKDTFIGKNLEKHASKREGKFLGETLKNLNTKFGEFVGAVKGNEGKILKKSLGKAGLYTAAVLAGLCLIGKGISSLFAKKED
jgi:hypothetical protein